MIIDANGKSHHPDGPGGGRFATGEKPENPGASLQSGPRKTSIGVTAVSVLDHYAVQPLPQWPADLPEPSSSYSWDEDSNLETIINFGGDTLTIWGETATTNACDSFTEIPDERPDITAEQQRMVSAYGYQMHANLVSLTGQMEYAVHTPAVRNAIEAIAAGTSANAAYDPRSPAWRTPAQRGTTRAESALAAWFGSEINDSTLQEVMTDLQHYADAHGLGSDAISEALEDGTGIYRDELENPEG